MEISGCSPESFLEQLLDTNYAEREHKVDGVLGSCQPWIIGGFCLYKHSLALI